MSGHCPVADSHVSTYLGMLEGVIIKSSLCNVKLDGFLDDKSSLKSDSKTNPAEL
jgi:hypothetical protein